MRLFALVTLLFTAGTILLHLLILLAGVKETGVLREFYWISVETNGISNAQPVTQWYMYNTCGGTGTVDKVESTGCGSSKPAFPFSPYDNFDKTQDVPTDFIEHRNKYFYMSRFLMPFFLIALFFEVCVMFLQLFAICSRILAVISAVISFVGWLFATAAAALATACFIIGRNTFQNAGYNAKVGVKMFAFIWTAMFLSTCVTFLLPFISKRRNNSGAANEIVDVPFETSSAHFGANSGVYKFGFGSRKTTDGPATNEVDNDASSFVRAV